LRATVGDMDFDVPLAGATVQIVELGLRVDSNDQGQVAFPQVPAGRYTVVAWKDGYQRTVRADVVVNAGQLTELRLDLRGDFTDMEEYVVRQPLQADTGTENALLALRIESPALMDSISADLMSKAGASDAAGALRLVAGASTADGKTAVIRGLPDRYVSSQMNGVLLPTADEDKRAVELDQFPAEVIQSLQVSKSFTPDQQGNASGGAVNVVLKGVPDVPFFSKWKVGSGYNDNLTGRNRFLTSEGGGVHAFGKSGGERGVQELGENWDGAVGTSYAEAPVDSSFGGGIGGKVDLGGRWRAGGSLNIYHDRSSGYFRNGRDDSLYSYNFGEALSPVASQGTQFDDTFITSLLDIEQGKQSVQWGGLATFGVATDGHEIALAWLSTRIAEDTATRAEDTRGKHYFFPGHDPETPGTPGYAEQDAAPYQRLHTIEYVERATDTLQLSGRHKVEEFAAMPAEVLEVDWTVAKSRALRDQPDRRQFGVKWTTGGFYLPLKPAAQFVLGNMQRVFERTLEDSEEAQINLKVPFDFLGNGRGYVKFGAFYDKVDRKFDQDTFSNFSDPNAFYAGRFDEFDWSEAWGFQDHLVTASDFDIDYRGAQELEAYYVMVELPVLERVRLISGARLESTKISIVNSPEEDALWIPPGEFGIADLEPGDGDASYARDKILPSVALVYDPIRWLTLRAAYSETVGRQTFKELSPVFQQEYLGGPVFVGNPDLEMSTLRNYDLRADATPFDGSLFSLSWFRKDVFDVIEYVEKRAQYTVTTAVNYPRGMLDGYEVEGRQQLGTLWGPLDGLAVGANSTWIHSRVMLPDDELIKFENTFNVRQSASRDMTGAPEFLYNLFCTWDLAATGTGVGLFYTVTGDTLVQGPGPANDIYVPGTYEIEYDTLNFTLSQKLGSHVKLSFSAKNLTNPTRTEVYRGEFVEGDTIRRTRDDGIGLSLSIGGEIRF
jgi:outer membrane receptor protein involved in Fe transport